MSEFTDKWGNLWKATKEAAIATKDATVATAKGLLPQEDERTIEVIMAIKQCPREDALVYLDEWRQRKEMESVRAITEKNLKGE